MEKHQINVVAFNGSSREDGNTSYLTHAFLNHLEKEGIHTTYHLVGNEYMHWCTGYFTCNKNGTGLCVFTDDHVEDYLQEMVRSDIIVMASPTRAGTVAGQLKIFMERVTAMAKGRAGFPLAGKIGVPIAIDRRAGALITIDALINFFHNKAMIIPGSTYWPFGIGLDAGNPADVSKDHEALLTIKNLAFQTAWLAKKIKNVPTTDKATIEIPERYKKNMEIKMQQNKQQKS